MYVKSLRMTVGVYPVMNLKKFSGKQIVQKIDNLSALIAEFY